MPKSSLSKNIYLNFCRYFFHIVFVVVDGYFDRDVFVYFLLVFTLACHVIVVVVLAFFQFS